MILIDSKFNIRVTYNPLGSAKIDNILRGGSIEKDKLLIADEEYFTYPCDNDHNAHARSKRRKMSMMNDSSSCMTEIGAENKQWTDFWTDPNKAYEACKKHNKNQTHPLQNLNDLVSKHKHIQYHIIIGLDIPQT